MGHQVPSPLTPYHVICHSHTSRQFNNKADWPADGSQPFVYSYGDATGYGQHGDYLFGVCSPSFL